MGKKLKVKATNQSREQNASLESKLVGNQPFLAQNSKPTGPGPEVNCKVSWLNLSQFWCEAFFILEQGDSCHSDGACSLITRVRVGGWVGE